MTGGPGSNDLPPTPGDEEIDSQLRDPAARAWTVEHMTDLRRSAYGQRLLYQSLVVGLVLGLAAHIGGYLLRPSPTTEPLGLVADLLYALGCALWTGVVVAAVVQVLPEFKRRQFQAWLTAYEAARRHTQLGDGPAPGKGKAPTAKQKPE